MINSLSLARRDGGYVIQRLMGEESHCLTYLANSIAIPRLVVLKLYLDPFAARQDRDAWLAAESIQGTPCLLDYFLAQGPEIHQAMGPLGVPPGVRFPSQTPVAALSWVNGESPVVGLPADHPIVAGESWRNTETQAMEGWGWSWRHDARLRFFSALVDIVAACHSLRPAKIHGDLSPENVVFLPRWNQLFLGDYVKRQQGTLGWRSPWHEAAGAPLPQAADVYSLLLWGLRLFPHEAAQWRFSMMLAECADDPKALCVFDLIGWEPPGPPEKKPIQEV